jgi:hypothetical protein
LSEDRASYFSHAATEARLAKLRRSSKVSGTTGANLVRGAQALGLSARIVNHADFKTIKAGYAGVSVIVDGMSINHRNSAEIPV